MSLVLCSRALKGQLVREMFQKLSLFTQQGMDTDSFQI